MKTGIADIDQAIAKACAAAADKYGTEALGRITASTLTSFEASRHGDPRQRPTWAHTPGLEARPWWEREQCGRLIEMIHAFEGKCAQIRDELASMDPGRMGVPYDHLSVDPELIRGWKNLFFYRDHKPNEELLAKVPAIDKLVRQFGPEHLDRFELFLSMLEPGTHIPAHFGGTNLKLTLHLPLWIPEGDTALQVDGEARRWKDGEMMIFDDTYLHDAWNRTPKPRAVLLMKVYHPGLSVEEIGVLEMLAPLNVMLYRAALKEKGRGG